MTTTLPAPAPAKANAGTRRDRRWLRVAIPFAVLFTLIAGTLIVHAIEQPDQDDDAFLSPVSSAGIGGGELAARLRAKGVTVVRETSTTNALSAARGGDVTLFVTTPELTDIDRLSGLGALPPGTRLVVVAPSKSAIDRTTWPILQNGGDRWTTAVAAPGCADQIATAAGPAAVDDLRYTSLNQSSCYNGALMTVTWSGATITVTGAADPFRNDRIAEHGNAALAVGLLSQTSRVIWLDVHHRETPLVPSSSPTSESAEEPVTRPSSGQSPRETAAPRETRDPRPREEPQSQPNPLAEAFPSALWATLALLALALLALAIAAARRLGAPVAEPLPSRVPANETMLGHARLYQRARAREETLDILRAAARRRLTAHLGLPAGATAEDIAESAGYDADDVREILTGFHPENDAELVSAANAVQNLVREITGFEGDQS